MIQAQMILENQKTQANKNSHLEFASEGNYGFPPFLFMVDLVMDSRDSSIFILGIAFLVCLAAVLQKVIEVLEDIVFEEACMETCHPYRYDLFERDVCACSDENDEIKIVEIK